MIPNDDYRRLRNQIGLAYLSGGFIERIHLDFHRLIGRRYRLPLTLLESQTGSAQPVGTSHVDRCRLYKAANSNLCNLCAVQTVTRSDAPPERSIQHPPVQQAFLTQTVCARCNISHARFSVRRLMASFTL